jgi:hypothetical protein
MVDSQSHIDSNSFSPDLITNLSGVSLVRWTLNLEVAGSSPSQVIFSVVYYAGDDIL